MLLISSIQKELASINVYVTNLSECISFGSHKNRSCGSAVGYPAYFHLQGGNSIGFFWPENRTQNQAKNSIYVQN